MLLGAIEPRGLQTIAAAVFDHHKIDNKRLKMKPSIKAAVFYLTNNSRPLYSYTSQDKCEHLSIVMAVLAMLKEKMSERARANLPLYHFYGFFFFKSRSLKYGQEAAALP